MVKTTITTQSTAIPVKTEITVGKTTTTVTTIPDEQVYCPGCGEELGLRAKLAWEDMRGSSDQEEVGKPVRLRDADGQLLRFGRTRYIYLCAECAERWSVPEHTVVS